MDKRTPLYEEHLALGGKMVSFGGYSLPVQYSGGGAVKEHMVVRQAVGLFDVSHMGELLLEGPDALENIQNLCTNHFATLVDGHIRYTPMCYQDGGIVDDMIVYRFSQNKFMLVVNAANHDKDVSWVKQHLFGDVTCDDQSEAISLIAVQGPRSKTLLTRIMAADDLPEKYYSFKEHVTVADFTVLVSQTGYTGELGYELYVANQHVVALWRLLLAQGADLGVMPCGLGARNTLRLEAGMPLYGHEMSETINPFEADIAFAVKLNKDHFIGKEALVQLKQITRKRIGIEVIGRGIVREGAVLFDHDQVVGQVTSGTFVPYLKKAVANALVTADLPSDVSLEAEVRGRRLPVQQVKLPFYKK